jgi:hypothetical protein
LTDHTHEHSARAYRHPIGRSPTDGPANIAATAMTNAPVPYIAAATAPNRSPAHPEA